ncbi:hypothetical protein EES40_00625 [Streptomyces sp. ADI93-02]|nr:hypothetical protein EES40_00625 [Streptomyces sp. ADI93-02]
MRVEDTGSEVEARGPVGSGVCASQAGRRLLFFARLNLGAAPLGPLWALRG